MSLRLMSERSSGAARHLAARLLSLLVLSLLLLAALSAAGNADFARPERYGIRDIVLVYRGRAPLSADQLLPLVAYVDRGGKAKAWFFDAFLLLPSKVFVDFTGHSALTQKDWARWLDALFADDGMVPALERAIEKVQRALGERPAPANVILALGDPGRARADRPPPFGDLDGDGRPENLRTDADRIRAIELLVDQLIARWSARPHRNLRLWGFYWYPEAVKTADRDVVSGVARAVHQRGLRLLWIPWFRAPGWDKWRELGFDLAVMQPNYAFLPPVDGGHLPDDVRLTETAAMARQHGMGVEMETRYALDKHPYDRALFRLYLNHAVTDGYVGAVRAHFQSFDQYVRLARAESPAARSLYDDLYALHAGTLTPRCLSLLSGATAILAASRRRQDVSFLLGEGRPASPRPVPLAPGDKLFIRLARPGMLSELRLRLAREDDLRVPRAFDVYGRASAADEWSFITSVTGVPRSAAALLMATWPARVCRELMVEPVLFAGSRCAVTSIVSFPELADAPVQSASGSQGVAEGERSLINVALGCPYAVWPQHARLYPDSGGELTDGVLTERGFADGRTVGWHQTGLVRVEIDLGRTVPVDEVRVFAQGGGMGAVRWPAALWIDVSGDGRRWRLLTDREAARKVVVREEGEWGVKELGWMRVAGQGEQARFVRVNAVPDGWLMLSEVEVISGRENVARGRPYRLRPLPSAKEKYADDGVMLTDGVAMKLWSRCVGWTAKRAAVVVDLGREWAIERVEVYVLGGGRGAVFFPRRVEVRTASGEEGLVVGDMAALVRSGARGWSEAVPASLPAANEEDAVTDGWVVARIGGRRARMVRVNLFGGRGWMMVGEVRVMVAGDGGGR